MLQLPSPVAKKLAHARQGRLGSGGSANRWSCGIGKNTRDSNAASNPPSGNSETRERADNRCSTVTHLSIRRRESWTREARRDSFVVARRSPGSRRQLWRTAGLGELSQRSARASKRVDAQCTRSGGSLSPANIRDMGANDRCLVNLLLRFTFRSSLLEALDLSAGISSRNSLRLVQRISGFSTTA